MRIKLSRTLLQYSNTEYLHSSSDSITTFQANNNDSVTTAIGRPFKLSAPFDSSMALTILVLLTALFFMGFFSIYIRHFTNEPTAVVAGDDDDDRRRRNLPASSSTNVHRSCRKGIDSSTIQSLPLVSYGGASKHLIEDCPICLTEFEASELIRLIPYCRHVFHQQCLDTWLSSHVTCPLCRSTQFFKKADDLYLDVVEVENGNGVSGESTVQECDTCRNIRRSCSFSNLGNRVALHRSASF
ncbi:putative coiled-coil domain-containing protein-like [Capsicum annuum]|uniref:RING-H2 finger protein ATL57 n=1 Tax=Capsicum annuum TaxID=4072 RepID=UPI0007BF07C4|nr:RING-H2 finger protein ATL57 [Capsicum annuum]KAF3639903.1 putative coiled-coil domain-containing protein-like [Capsicum annuum]